MQSHRSLFQQLRWQLTFSYTGVTVAAVLVVAGLILAALLPGLVNRADDILVQGLASGFYALAPQYGPFLENQPPDQNSLRVRLEQGFSSPIMVQLQARAAVLDAGSQPVSAWPADFDPARLPAFGQFASRVFAGEATPSRLYSFSTERELTAVAPIVGRDERLRGLLAVSVILPRLEPIVITLIIGAVLALTLAAGLLGTLFGALTARGLTRRLHAVAQAADAWGQGDFSRLIPETGKDEIGQLARRLNQMAGDVQFLVQTRQELAALEERNRLARDLHDSVKQQLFATSMQLGAARETLEQDPATARAHLQEAEGLARQARDELTRLILALRPAALEGHGLAAALRAYVETWGRQSGIAAEVHIQGERALALPAEQALFRVVQEALANTARHSGAARVTVTLSFSQASTTLIVADDGCGFDLSAATPGVGLASMRERLAAPGGRLRVESAPGAGTRVTAILGEPYD